MAHAHTPTPATLPERAPGAASAPSASLAEGPRNTSPPTPRQRPVWEAVQERRGLGPSLRQMAREVGLHRRTVRQYVAVDQPPVSPPRRPRTTQLPPSLGDLAQRWAEGCHHARRRHQELVQRGYRGSEGMVRVVVRPWRLAQETSPPALTPAQLAWLHLPPAGRLTEADRKAGEDGRHANPV